MTRDVASRGHRFRRAQRLRGRRAFAAVFATRRRRRAGPLTFHARPNGMGFNRLGLSVGRRVGSAVKRARIKRMLREAFRLTQHQPPQGYDLVIVVHPHEPKPQEAYQRLVLQGRQTVAEPGGKAGRREGGKEGGK